MNWRTDKPTAEVIVVNHTDSDIYDILRRIDGKYYLYTMFGAKEIPIDEIKKWADLEEDETVTDCDELKEEVKKYINNNWEYEHSNKNAPLYLYDFSDKDLLNAARHFAKWGAEHLIDANKMIDGHIADDSKKVELRNNSATTSQELEEAAEEWCKKNHKGIALAGDKKSHYLADGLDAFIAGANLQIEQFHDACYQCERAYDNVFYRGEQHAIKMMKEEATEATVYEDAGGYPFVPAIEMYDYDKDEPTAKKGDKVKVIILKDGNED